MAFEFAKLTIPDLILVKPNKYSDHRGYFLETYKYSEFRRNGISNAFVQDNFSFSFKGVIRGLHFQKGPRAQGKLIEVIKGSIFDVVVDIRPTSPTFGMWISVNISTENHFMLYIPEGFAHGFQAIEDAEVHYKVTKEFDKPSEGGIRWNDSFLNIDWPLSNSIVSEKDSNLPSFFEQRNLFL